LPNFATPANVASLSALLLACIWGNYTCNKQVSPNSFGLLASGVVEGTLRYCCV